MKKTFFNYGLFLKGYENIPDKKEAIKKYEEKFNIEKSKPIEEHPFYKEYLSKFNFDFELTKPEDVTMSQSEWDLLTRLVLASLSSTYSIELDEEWRRHPTDKIKVRLRISVESKGSHITKYLDELFSFQILRLFQIYVNEQIELFMMWQEENEDYGWMDEHNNIGMEAEGNDYESWVLKQEFEAKCQKFEKRQNDLKQEAETYKKLFDAIF